MKLDKNSNILIVGLGLMGGSYAMALKKQGYRVSAITAEQKSVDFALAHGLIDRGTVEVDPALIRAADLVIIALYPHIFIDWIKKNGGLFKKGTIVTDVTGVKGCVADTVQQLLPDGVEFIAAHPMAGREVSGVENSNDGIFRDANYIVVPTARNTPAAISLCRDLGETLGFHDISELSPREHDRMIAFLSQLTHCIAVSLMCACDAPDLVRYTGDSFRDLTRIARINDEMWSELFLANRDALLYEMERFGESFERLTAYLRSSDREGMREMMRLSTARRGRFDKKPQKGRESCHES